MWRRNMQSKLKSTCSVPPPVSVISYCEGPHTFLAIYFHQISAPARKSVAQVLQLQNGHFLQIIFLPVKIDKYQTRYFGTSPHPEPNMGQILDRYFPAAKGCRRPEYGTRAPPPTLLLAVEASRHDGVTCAVLVRRGGKH